MKKKSENKKAVEPQTIPSLLNNPMINYRAYYFSSGQKILFFILVLTLAGLAGLVFYGGMFKEDGESTIATYISNTVVFVLVGLVATKFFLPVIREMLKKRRDKQLKRQFKDLLESLTTALASGGTVNDAFVSADVELRNQYTDSDLIIVELDEIVAGLNNGYTIENLLNNFGQRSDNEDIENFANVMGNCYRLGGDFKNVMRKTRDIISDKMQIDEEINTKLTSNKIQLDGAVAANAFTIDKTLPTVSVSYDNHSAQNSNYYSASRTATIVIDEHNFQANRVNIMMSATNDGASISTPSVNGWNSNGNTHTATIHFDNDALYNFDIICTDLAGNSSADYTQDSFYIDKTAPSIQITGIENMSANNGDVVPIVTCTDTNFDSSQMKITLSGVNRNEVSPVGSYSEVHNGSVFTFANFEKVKEVDDIYMLTASLTDRAGNSTTSSIRFSVNRFGSTYILDENTKKMNNSYVKDAQDVVITEINTDTLSNIKILLFKNNETIVLKEGTDYQIDVSGGNGNWYQVVYTIFKSNFADDGVYRLSIHSEDAAGNIAENTLDTKETEIGFGVDKTLPTININNLESGKTYALEKMTVLMSVTDNLNLTRAVVYLDGNEHSAWEGESMETMIADGGNFSFDIAGDSTKAHTVKIVAMDAAGNEQTEEIDNFFVTTNIWIRYYNNKPLFFGSIAAVILAAALVIFLIVWKRRKNEKKQKAE